jgi:hypothetical protein
MRLVVTVESVKEEGPFTHFRWKVEADGQLLDDGGVGFHNRRQGWRELLRRVLVNREAADPVAWLSSDRFDRVVRGAIMSARRDHPEANGSYWAMSVTKRIVQMVRGELGLTVPEGRRGMSTEKLGEARDA